MKKKAKMTKFWTSFFLVDCFGLSEEWERQKIARKENRRQNRLRKVKFFSENQSFSSFERPSQRFSSFERPSLKRTKRKENNILYGLRETLYVAILSLKMFFMVFIQAQNFI
eukprot:GDKJ01059298.1.p1 GENE.GDKJ01059298.1~~GDKJ01059298.1.p1  ORF type:complete len:112 (-),score=15.40 GDKJ01059298.1:1935-2270(-)